MTRPHARLPSQFAGQSSAVEGEAWAQDVKAKSRWNRPGLDVGAVSVFENWFKPEKKEGSAKVFGPTPPASA